jgi:hypothetical protein
MTGIGTGYEIDTARTPFRFLIVEDNDDDYEGIADALQASLKSVALCRIASEHEFDLRAGEIASALPYLIIVDVVLRWQVPDPIGITDKPAGASHRAGIRIWNRLQQNEHARGIPTIVCSHLDLRTFFAEVTELPCNLYFAPRKDPDEIATLVLKRLASSPTVLRETGISRAELEPSPKKVFVSYARQDRQSQYRIRNVLAPMVRSNQVEFWDDTSVEDGQLWQPQVLKHLNSADAGLVLAISDSLASRFINEVELPHLLRRHERETLPLFWVAVRPALYAQTALHRFQCLNDPKRPLEHLSTRQKEVALVEIAKRLAVSLGIMDSTSVS